MQSMGFQQGEMDVYSDYEPCLYYYIYIGLHCISIHTLFGTLEIYLKSIPVTLDYLWGVSTL